MSEVTSAWDAKFIDEFSHTLLFDSIVAANFLDVKPFLDLACGKVAAMVRNRSPEDLRKEFNIVNDFTPEEEVSLEGVVSFSR
jgi:S-phase kinase-associated protein 1